MAPESSACLLDARIAAVQESASFPRALCGVGRDLGRTLQLIFNRPAALVFRVR